MNAGFDKVPAIRIPKESLKKEGKEYGKLITVYGEIKITKNTLEIVRALLELVEKDIEKEEADA